MGTLADWFNWPSGSVLTNLLASLLWAPLAGAIALLWARVHIRRLHERHDAHEAKLDALTAQVRHLGSTETAGPVSDAALYRAMQQAERRNGRGRL